MYIHDDGNFDCLKKKIRKKGFQRKITTNFFRTYSKYILANEFKQSIHNIFRVVKGRGIGRKLAIPKFIIE